MAGLARHRSNVNININKCFKYFPATYQRNMNMITLSSLGSSMAKSNDDDDDERLGRHHDGRPLSRWVAVPSSPLSS